MKIGTFAKHFNINKSKVRYYTEINLLIPDLSNTYPDYNASCIKDMEDIIQFKAMGLSIEEIHELKLLERFYVNLSENNLNKIHELLNDKIRQHTLTLQATEQQINMIKNYQSGLNVKEITQHFGVPFEVLKHLICPKCHSPFSVKDAAINNNIITSGQLLCDCGQYNITKGILMKDDSIIRTSRHDKHLENVNHTEKMNNKHIASLKKYGQYVSDVLSEWDHSKGIVFANADIDILMMQLDKVFRKNGLYFLCGQDYTSLMLLQAKLALQESEGHFIFIFYEKEVPLSKDLPYLVDNAGNLLDLILNHDLGYNIKPFEHLISKESHWLSIHLIQNQVDATKPYSQYFKSQPYDDIYTSMGLSLKIHEQLCKYDYTEHMINGVKNIKSLNVFCKQWNKKVEKDY